MKNKGKKGIALVLALSMALMLGACSSGGTGASKTTATAAETTATAAETEAATTDHSDITLTYAEPGWMSTLFTNQVMKVVLEQGYGYKTEPIEATNVALVEALTKNEVDIHTYIAELSFETYEELRDSGKLIEWGSIHDDGMQGVYVPTYMIKGDAERGIDPITPDLKTIDDLKDYWETFKDPEDPTKGVFYNAPADYLAANVLNHKLETYGLTEYYNIITPGSQGAEDATLKAAYDKGEPWVGYGFVVSYMYSQFDLTKLEDRCAFDPKLYNEENGYACDFVLDSYKVCSSTEFEAKAPEVTDFLSKFHLSGKIIADGIGYMTNNDNPEGDKAAIDWLKNNTDTWKTWVPEDVAANIEAYLSTL